MSEEFDKQLLGAIQSSVLHLIKSGEWLKIDWGSKVVLSKADLDKMYKAIDMDRVLALAKEKVEEKLADAIIIGMATEIASDVKKIMCNTELREDLRHMLRNHMQKALGANSRRSANGENA